MKYSLIAALFLITSQASFAMDNNDFDFDTNSFWDSDEDHNTDSEKAAKRVKLTTDQDDSNNNNNNDDEKKLFFCEVSECKKAAKPYKGLSGLWYHMRHDHALASVISKPKNKGPEKPFKCPHSECDKSFELERSVSRHISINHNHEVKNSCHFCTAFPEKVLNKAFLNKPYYDRKDFSRHLRSHTRPYQCNVCAKRIALKEALAKHEEGKHGVTNNAQQTREESAKFFCPLCGLELLTDLPNHKPSCRASLEYALTQMGVPASEENLAKIGFDENKYVQGAHLKCLICDKVFNSQQGRSRHTVTVHNISTFNPTDFECLICGVVCKSGPGLTHHMTSSHRTLKPTRRGPIVSNIRALLLPKPPVLAPNHIYQDDRITNAPDDPSHQPEVQIQLKLEGFDDPFIPFPPENAFIPPK